MAVLSVSELNVYVRELIEQDFFLEDVWVEGEISNLKYFAQGGQYYFTLSDSQAQVNCVIYASFIPGLKFKLANGVMIAVRGKLKFFHKKGSLSFQVVYAVLKGVGGQSKQFQLLKEKLLKEGLFEASHKKQVPMYPEKIALITSLHSAAMWDFVTIIRQWAPHIELFIVPAVMQGLECPGSVLEALALCEPRDVDVTVVLRGGGSAEDLAGFNNEVLVRAMATFKKPLITALGHEIDYTLADFVADLRMPTPSAAADHVSRGFQQLSQLFSKLPYLHEIVHQHAQALTRDVDVLLTEASVHLDRKCKASEDVLSGYLHRLHLANPLHKLRQGYSMARLKTTGEVVRYMSQIQPGAMIETQISDGFFESRINP